jgi:molybdopterin-guanine dinucleotide biosynthesis protein
MSLTSEFAITVHDDVTGIVLAGGKSSRMGKDKALLPMPGGTMLSVALLFLRQHFYKVMISGDRPDLEGKGVQVISDSYPGCSLAGIHSALKAADTDWVFVMPCDMPFPSTSILNKLLKERLNADAVVPRTDKGCEPLFALYHRRVLEVVERFLQQKRFRIYDLFEVIDVNYIVQNELTENSDLTLLNINTPQDYQFACAQVSSQTYAGKQDA